jgi:hypothetical protein
MHYYNAKSKVIMKGRGSRGVRGVRRSRRGGQALIDGEIVLGGGKRHFIKRTCRSKSRCGGANFPHLTVAATDQFTTVLGGGKRPFIKRTCRSKSRCGGAALVALRPYTRGGYYGFH